MSYVDLSEDGRTLAVGAQYDDTIDTNAGSTRVFRLDAAGDDWVQLGQSIYGGEPGAQFGTYVHISRDGQTVAFSGFSNDGSKLARVYSYQVGKDLWIQNGDDLYGPCLKLSDDGKQVITCSDESESCSIYDFDDEENDWRLIVTLGPDPTVCQGATSADLTYSATTENPNRYTINYDAAAEAVGFVDVAWKVICKRRFF